MQRRPKARHHSLALYVLLRGVTLLVRCGNKPDAPPAVRALLAPTRWRHGDTGLMCLCTSQARPARAGQSGTAGNGNRGMRSARRALVVAARATCAVIVW